MNTELTPPERRAVARTIAKALSKHDLLREEVYALLEINPKAGEKIEELEEKIEGLEGEIQDFKNQIADAKEALS